MEASRDGWKGLATVVAVAVLLIAPYFLFSRDDGQDAPGIFAELNGGEQKVFDWSEDACETMDIPDSPARAFRDQDGQVN